MKRIAQVSILLTGTLLLGAAIRPRTKSPDGLTVHEWGTFTSIAGKDGLAVDWLPLDGPSDLPCFVFRFGTNNFKGGLSAKVRMETPVLYFYATRPITLSARVRFRGGEITEWYPQAAVTRANVPNPFAFGAMRDPDAAGRIEWRNVKVSPGASEDYPVESSRSHYYAARRTDAAPLESPSQKEKFLFYRGLGSFALPITTTSSDDGAILVKIPGGDEIGGLVLFVNHGGKVGFRIQTAVGSAVTLTLPSLDGDVVSLGHELEHLLSAQGLYPREASAMVETWRDSWLEEGTRVLYIVPRRIVDAVLPLEVNPAPRQTVRVFVGRMEVITPGVEKDVRDALSARDRVTLAKYGRFLQPISDRILQSTPQGAGRTRIEALLQSIASARAGDSSTCAER